MINVTQNLKNDCANPTSIHREYITVGNQTVDIKGKLEATAYKNTTFFGTFNMKALQFEAPNDIKYRNKEVVYYKQVNNETFKVGTFIVTNIRDVDTTETVKVTATDYGLKFAVPYVTELDYASGNVTLMNVLQECCTKAGVELENTSIENGNFIVDSNQFVNDELIGDVVSAIAGISGNFATITEDDKLRLMFKNPTSEIIEDYTELQDKRDTHPITSVAIGNKDIEGQEAIRRDQALIDKYGEKIIAINDNPFAYTYEKREQLVDAIFNKIKGFGYSSFVSKYSYKPYMTLGDTIKFKNKNGDLIDSIILKYKMDYENVTLEAPSMTSSEVDYKQAQTPEEIARKTQIIVNQQEAKINANASKIEDNIQNISNLQITSESISTTVQNNTTEIGTLSSTTKQTSENLQIQINQVKNDANKDVTELKNKLVTIDVNGISVSTNISAIKTLMTNEKFVIKSGDTTLAYFGYDSELGTTKAEMDNLTIDHYLTTGYHRIEKQMLSGEKRTVFFFVGGDDYGF